MLNLGNAIPQGSSEGLSGLLVFHTTLHILISPAGANNTPTAFQDITSFFPAVPVISIRYEDHISFQTDNLELICPDIGDKIIRNSSIQKGAWLKVQVHQWNAEYPGSHTMLDTGSFQIDQIKQSGPPTQIIIMATSVPISSTIKLTLKNNVRLTTDIKTLAQQVADDNKVKLKWDVQNETGNLFISQAEQWNESDLQMLSRYCKSRGLSMKFVDGALVIFNEQEYENRPPVYTIDFGDPGIFSIGGKTPGLERWELTTQSQDIYSIANLSFYDSYSAQTINSTVYAPDGTAIGTEEELNTHQDVQSPKGTTPGEDIGGGD